MNHTTSFAYDQNKLLSSATDANGKITSYGYDILDKLATLTDPLNQITTYTYNADGLLASITNPKGNVTNFTYDNAERLVSVKDPLNRITSFGYDPNGNITSRTDGNGKTVQYSYDNINRLTTKSFPDLTSIQFSYDPGSRRTQMTDIDGRITNYSYDAANRLTSVSGYSPTINYGYDDVGNLTSFTDLGPGNSTAYAYDALNRITSVTYNTNKVFNYGYDTAGRLTSKSYPNGITSNYQYNDNNWLTLVSYMNGQTPLMSFQYTFDNVGTRLTKLQTLPQGTFSWQYAYDSLYRLTSETYPDNHAVTITYDANGNRLTRTENGNTINSTYDAADQLLTAGSLTFVWNGNGNLIQKTNGTATTNFAYDFENHLKQVTFPNTTTEQYNYNGDGLRIKKIPSAGFAVDYFLTGADVWHEQPASGGPPPTDYILAGSMAGPLGFKQPGSPNPIYHYTHGDSQGSIMGLTDDAGTITDQYQYDAWGNPANLPNSPPNQTYNPYHYTGQQVDPSTSLYYLRNRYYDAQAGRFITEDPAGGLNLFAYCGNNPVNFWDPLGLYFLGANLRVALKKMDWGPPGESQGELKQAIRQIYIALDAKSQNGVLGMSRNLKHILNEPKFIIDLGVSTNKKSVGFADESENTGYPDPVFGFTGKINVTQLGLDNFLGYGINEIILHELLHAYIDRMGLQFASQQEEEEWIESWVTYYFPKRLFPADTGREPGDETTGYDIIKK